jgi:transposase
MASARILAPFLRLARGFRQQSEKVCGFVKHGLTSGLNEGFNNLIARMIHNTKRADTAIWNILNSNSSLVPSCVDDEEP